MRIIYSYSSVPGVEPFKKVFSKDAKENVTQNN